MLINKSTEFGTYPSKLKLAKVIPVYKSGDESDPSNYRPISLLSIFNRTFEKMVYNHLKSFIEKCNTLHDSRSTENAILDIINEIETNVTWIKGCTHVVCSMTCKKPLTQ